MSGKIEIRENEKRRRGEFLETIVRDITRVGNPPAASIFERDNLILVVPTNSQYAAVQRESISSAVSYVEQIIPDEGRRF